MSFEDYERSVIDLKVLLFKSLYAWLAVYNSHHFSWFFEFLEVSLVYFLYA